MAQWRGCSLQGFGFPLQPWRRLQQGLGSPSQLGTWVTAPKTCEQVPRGPAARRDPPWGCLRRGEQAAERLLWADGAGFRQKNCWERAHGHQTQRDGNQDHPSTPKQACKRGKGSAGIAQSEPAPPEVQAETWHLHLPREGRSKQGCLLGDGKEKPSFLSPE